MAEPNSDSTTCRLDAGEVLFEIGSTGDDVYLVLSGELDVVTPTANGDDLLVGSIGADELVGELTAVIGGTRSATVRAAVPSVLERFDRDGFERWLDAEPNRPAMVAEQARARIDRTRVSRVVADLVGNGHPELVAELTNSVTWIGLRAGETLFSQGDASDAAYVLVAGQMRVQAIDEDGVCVLDSRIGRGDLVGEMGVIEQAPRRASAFAIRDCTLACIPKDRFHQITARYPALMLPLVRKVIERVGEGGYSKAHAGAIAVIVTAPSPPRDLVATLVDEIGRFGAVDVLSPSRLADITRRDNIADAAPASAAEARINELIHEYDVANRWLILDAADPTSRWAQRTLRMADRVIVVASPFPTAAEQATLARVRAVVEATGDYELWLAQLNPGGTTRPRGTTALLQATGAERVIHLRGSEPEPIRRLARLLSGNGVGLALSGGGARSFGQIGAVRALDEQGIAVDAIAGTSMGSVIGATLAKSDDPTGLADWARAAFAGAKLLDYTIPMTSIFGGRRINSRIDDIFGNLDVVDTLIPYQAISTNVSKACVVEHRTGSLARAVRASVSLPGVFPPVVVDGDLLIDGGVLENLPVRPLRSDPAIGTVIAIDVAPPGGPRARGDYDHSLSTRDLLRQRVRDSRWHHPPLASMVISSMLVGSSQARTASIERGDIDLYVSLNLRGVKLLDFSVLERAMSSGYTDAEPLIAEWVAGRSATG